MTGESGIRILVVSDDDTIRKEMEFGVPAGMEVQCVVDARAAWRSLQERIPSAVVVDLQTGSAGGFGLRKDMLAVKRLAGVPLLMLLERAQDEWLARQAGANAYRVKPIDTFDLVRCVLDLLPEQPPG